ncbi:MAG: hypothetical protein ACRCT8_02795 [Lacipirellulaceae bacterium]
MFAQRSLCRTGNCSAIALLLTLNGAPAEGGTGLAVFSGSGSNAAAIQGTVDSFRAALGTLNPNNGSSFASGRREINWDAVPDTASDPNLFPGDFFNSTTVAGRSRGAIFTTPGTGFLTSADASNPTSTSLGFGFSADFVPFSAERLFTPIGSNVVNVTFAVPGQGSPATVSAFGAVFSDVESAATSVFEAFAIDGTLLFSGGVPTSSSGGFSFVGVQATAGEQIARVRLTLGDAVIVSNGNITGSNDTVVLDDFIYAEPQLVPEGTSLALAAAAVAAACGSNGARRRAAE